MSYKFAVGMYSVRHEMAKDLLGTLREVKAMGYEGVEFFGDFDRTAQEIKAALDDTGLVCVGWHTPWHRVVGENLMSTIEYNKALGNTEIVIPSLPREMKGSKAAWLDSAKQFNEVAEKLKDHGMKLAYHNHSEEFKAVEGDLPIRYLFDNTIPEVGLQLDNGNAFSAGPDTDIYDPIIRYKNRARTLHHKPYSLKTGFAAMIGEDDIDWPRYFKLVGENQNIEWHIVEYESTSSTPQMESIRNCINNLKAMEANGRI